MFNYDRLFIDELQLPLSEEVGSFLFDIIVQNHS